MALVPGTRLGHYEIVESIGVGGMGEVYRARDTKLGREVAIKVLPEELSRDRERRARFEREAKLLAALNHPCIATLHGLEESEGRQFLVMELVEGETLGERIARGPIPADESIPLFIQMAEGLGAAHGKGVIHRDLKPGNVKITQDGGIKILDFGLAKAFGREPDVSAETSQSPTLTRGTALGVIMGTASYMSPEQARGKTVDKRTDIWAFGCCLYEALTGRKVFDGETVTDVITAVIHKDPDWGVLPARTSRKMRELLARLLQKDARLRLHDIADGRLELEDVQAHPADAVREIVERGRPVTSLVVGIAIGAVVAAMTLWGLLRGSTPVKSQPVMEFEIELPAAERLWTRTLDPIPFALSPDGQQLVFIGGRGDEKQIYVRSMSERATRPVLGTEGVADTSLFVSPDGRWVGFSRDRTLWRTLIGGGIPVAILESTAEIWFAHWSDDDSITYNQGFSSLYRVSADGGEPRPLTQLDAGELAHFSPRLLPGNETLLFSVSVGNIGTTHIEALSLKTGQRKMVLENVLSVEYAPNGYLIFGRDETLLAAPFDVERAELTGPATPIVSGVLMEQREHRAALFALSRSGSLVYAPRDEGIWERLVWVDRQGNSEPLPTVHGTFRGPRLSPDGNALLIRAWNGSAAQIELHDLNRNVAAPLTSSADKSTYPVWSPDGRRMVFQSTLAERWEMFLMSVDGSGRPERLLEAVQQIPGSWSPDGKFLAYVEAEEEEQMAIWVLPMDSPGTDPQPFLVTENKTHSPAFSPNGRFLVYVSNESGQEEVFVTEFTLDGAETRAKQRVSRAGGWEPVWSRDGKELYYRNYEGTQLMVVTVDTETELRIGQPRKLFDEPNMPPPLSYPDGHYDVAPDGRFLMISEDESRNSPMKLVVVLNWLQELDRLMNNEN